MVTVWYLLLLLINSIFIYLFTYYCLWYWDIFSFLQIVLASLDSGLQFQFCGGLYIFSY